MKKNILPLCFSALALILWNSASAYAEVFQVSCPISHGLNPNAFVFTNVVIRNYPINPSGTGFVISNVRIFNDKGALVYQNVPTPLEKRVNRGVATAFSTTDVFSNSIVGRFSAAITFSGDSTSKYLSVLAVVIDADGSPNGKLLSRDTIVCRSTT